MRRTCRALLSLSLLAFAHPAAAAPQAVTITGVSVSPIPATSGIGLCIASNLSSSPNVDFPQSATTFNSDMNAFFEANRATRITTGLGTVLDLSNNLNDGRTLSFGDFTNAESSCAEGGCPFFVNDSTSAFASRLRGLYRVPASRAGKPIHFGIYADDAVSLTFFDSNQRAYPVIVRPPMLGVSTWRTTNAVTFPEEGLYGVEVLYAQIVEHAALEVSTLDGTFDDFEDAVGVSTSLKTSGFTLIGPGDFFQTEGGGASVPDPNDCEQCDRQLAGKGKVADGGSGDCVSGYHCNAAALCERCDSRSFCGDSCVSCFGEKPICGDVNGAFQCVQCNTNADCTGTNTCVEHHCEPCLSGEGCDAGVDAGVDAAVPDAEAPEAGPVAAAPGPSDDGCGCSAAGASPESSKAAALALMLLVAACVRRRIRTEKQ